ncbi:Zn-dependent hydrolase [Paenibacillus pinisoli]|uniref:Zn-dependent hydrolase n=1 Tax=Paenibacillus pinisoli TaxID=1276110 RepID=A0A3A6PLQ5_9BACL|nr:Zn-dependent hydrolase [Paenibacillus pinisoli]RJX41300.1 Zn-dependent hydrolase [Paenibacillus pinisoli]
MASSYAVQGARLWRSIEELGAIGADSSGGVTRLSLSAEELEGRAYVAAQMKAAGLEVRCDEAGNLIGRLEGSHPEAAAVITGSHIDTVHAAGRFDGTLGVLGGIEALRAIKEQGIEHERPLEIVCFTDEEGVRFGAGYLGSRAMAGDWRSEWLGLTDENGVTLREAMVHASLPPESAWKAKRPEGSVHAYVELHIEQGRALEHRGEPVGIATAIYGHRWLDVRMLGQADHAGTTPMPLRRDPLLAAAEAMLAVERTALSHGGVATVGKLRVAPGSANAIPGEARFTVDVRHEDGNCLERMTKEIEQQAIAYGNDRKVEVLIRQTDAGEPVLASEKVIHAITEGCRVANIAASPIVCGAGHDAVAISAVAPIGLILVRSKDGISHHSSEWSSPEDCEAGANVLLQTLIILANE